MHLTHTYEDQWGNTYPAAYSKVGVIQLNPNQRQAVIQVQTWKDEASYAAGKPSLPANGNEAEMFSDSDPQDNGDGTFSFRKTEYAEYFGQATLSAVNCEPCGQAYKAIMTRPRFAKATLVP